MSVSQEVITARVFDFLRHRGTRNAYRRVRVDVPEIVATLRDRFPSDPRPTVQQVSHALSALRLEGRIRFYGTLCILDERTKRYDQAKTDARREARQ